MDVKTAAGLLAVVNALMAIVLTVQYRFSRPQPGVGWWAAGQWFIAGGIAVGNLRGTSLLGLLAIPVHHLALMAGSLLIYVGIRRFLGKRERRAPMVALLVVILVEATVFTFVFDSVAARWMVLYTALAVALGMGAASAFRDRTPDVDRTAVFLGWILSVAAVLYLAEAVSQVLVPRPAGESVFTPSPLVTISYIVEVTATVLLTFDLILMINQRLSAKVAEDAANLRSVFESIPDAVVVSRVRDGVIVDANPGFTRMSGYSRAEAVEGSLRGTDLWANPGDRDRLVAELTATGACQDLQARMRLKDGSDLECVLNARTFHLGAEPHLVSVTRDISDELAMQEQLRRDATTDELTGVANRRHFLALAQSAVADASAKRYPLTLTMLDMDGLKLINDTLGHACGDAALVAFADMIGACLGDAEPADVSPASWSLGRVGGDEFALLLPGVDPAAGFDVVERLRGYVAESPKAFDGGDVALAFSAGIASLDGAGDSLEDLLARADAALYQAKNEGRNRVVLAAVGSP